MLSKDPLQLFISFGWKDLDWKDPLTFSRALPQRRLLHSSFYWTAQVHLTPDTLPEGDHTFDVPGTVTRKTLHQIKWVEPSVTVTKMVVTVTEMVVTAIQVVITSTLSGNSQFIPGQTLPFVVQRNSSQERISDGSHERMRNKPCHKLWTIDSLQKEGWKFWSVKYRCGLAEMPPE